MDLAVKSTPFPEMLRTNTYKKIKLFFPVYRITSITLLGCLSLGSMVKTNEVYKEQLFVKSVDTH